MGLAVRIMLLYRPIYIYSIRAEIYVISCLLPMAAIFDFQNMQTSDNIATSLSLFTDHKIWGIAVGIVLLSCLSAEICITECIKPPSLISDFRLVFQRSCPYVISDLCYSIDLYFACLTSHKRLRLRKVFWWPMSYLDPLLSIIPRVNCVLSYTLCIQLYSPHVSPLYVVICLQFQRLDLVEFVLCVFDSCLLDIFYGTDHLVRRVLGPCSQGPLYATVIRHTRMGSANYSGANSKRAVYGNHRYGTNQYQQGGRPTMSRATSRGKPQDSQQ